ncbi:hypothetical protein PTKIN_Ptkin15bG0150900 [Pterospermum kingtungense]
MGRTGMNSAVYALLIAYLTLSMTWNPLSAEARISAFSAIEENMVLQSLARRSLRKSPLPSNPSPQWNHRFHYIYGRSPPPNDGIHHNP